MLSLVVMCALMTISSAAQDERFMGGVGITVFADANFRGRSATYQQDVPNLARHGFDNMISSLRIGPGEQWEVCDLVNYRGRCVVVSREESNLSTNAWSNIISSFRRIGGGSPGPGPAPGNDYIVIFDRPNYQGSPTNYNYAISNLNRRSGSVTIGRGTWDLCDGANFTGRCITLSTSVPNLASYNMTNRVRSVRPARSGPIIPPVGDRYVVLFSQPNYRGNPRNYNGSVAYVAGNSGSITIGRGNWQICTGRNYTGRCVTLSNSVPNLARYNMQNRVRSLRPIAELR